MSVRILEGDNLLTLAGLAAESVHCVVTSPPYWGLRDYGLPATEWPEIEFVPMAGLAPVCVPAWLGCLGLEPDPLMFTGHIVHAFRAVWRVLRNDGTLWVNLGDRHAGGGNGGGGSFAQVGFGMRTARPGVDKNVPMQLGDRGCVGGLKRKDLCGMPWRCAFALQSDGWYLRMDNIWHKPNPMPERVVDRPTKAHEYFFLFSKSEHYFYDGEAIREPASAATHARLSQDVERQVGSLRANGGSRADRPMKTVMRGIGPKYARVPSESKYNASFSESVCLRALDRNKRSVWTVTTHGYKEAHFATFPPDLVRPAILAGTSAAGACADCGAPWRRVVDLVKGENPSFNGSSFDKRREIAGKTRNGAGERTAARITSEWLPGCDCYKGLDLVKRPVPSTVLDPFGGSGTVAAVAIEHGRSAILCEMKPEYVALARKRLSETQPGLF